MAILAILLGHSPRPRAFDREMRSESIFFEFECVPVVRYGMHTCFEHGTAAKPPAFLTSVEIIDVP